IGIWNTKREGQFFNINTPEQLEKFIFEKAAEYAALDKVYIIEPKYYDNFGQNCQSFKNELKSWSQPTIIPHIRDNILSDAKKVLGDMYLKCDLDKYEITLLKNENNSNLP
ncbi:MAG: hypothetical protein ACXAC2_20980, partial [Candidatus Kariarchaeaceae archaeon]